MFWVTKLKLKNYDNCVSLINLLEDVLKKLLAAFVLSLVLVIGCQDSTSILQPEATSDARLNKSVNGDFNFDDFNFDPGEDPVGINGSGRPGYPRF